MTKIEIFKIMEVQEDTMEVQEESVTILFKDDLIAGGSIGPTTMLG